MASVVDICNLALGKLGGYRIASIDNPQSDIEELCSLYYPIVRDLMLEKRDWTFLTKRVVLSNPVANPPAWGYGQAFAAPNDTYRIIDVRQNDLDNQPSTFEWRYESGQIVCDASVIYVRYITKDVATTSFSPNFLMTFATTLASHMCIQVTENAKLRDSLINESEVLLREACGNDNLQGKSQKINSSNIIRVR